METTLIILVSILVLLIIALLGTAAFFLFQFLKIKQNQNTTPILKHSRDNLIPEDLKNSIEIAKQGQIQIGQSCSDHSELEAKGICAISGKAFCELCITKHNDLKIAGKYLSLYLDFDWKEFQLIQNEKMGADSLNKLMTVKKDLWMRKQIPMITQEQFKINLENDKIETFTSILYRSHEEDKIQNALKFLN